MKQCLVRTASAGAALLLAGCGGGDDSGGGGSGLAGDGADGAEVSRWSVTRQGSILQIAYGSGNDFPQYAALHLDSSYFRMVYAANSGWGTSIIVMPSLWSGGNYFQGGAMDAMTSTNGAELTISIGGTVAGLQVTGTIELSPPSGDRITAAVSMQVSGDVPLDSRPGEAFKPVMLSSMHISNDSWDTQSVFIGTDALAIPASGWIVQPARSGALFGLRGGTSSWKVNAPTVEVSFDRPLDITGWVTASADPNDDNVGFWCASENLLASWSYTVTAMP